MVVLLSASIFSMGSPVGDKGKKNSYSSSGEQFCEEIDAEIQITHTSGGRANGEILVVFQKKTDGPYTLFLLSENGSRENRLEIKENKVTELKKGEYNLYIQNKEGCTKHIKTKIN